MAFRLIDSVTGEIFENDEETIKAELIHIVKIWDGEKYIQTDLAI